MPCSDIHPLQHLFENNRDWAENIKRQDPEFFLKLACQQTPEYLWIGCADSRVPANELLGLLPGDVFVHRNVANIVTHTDLNCLTVLQYAAEVLKVKHIIVCGHYGCSGVRAAMEQADHGLADNWLRNIKDIYYRYEDKMTDLSTLQQRYDLLCELNVLTQMANVCHTTIIQNAWHRGQELTVHGWIYDIRDGLLRDLGVTFNQLSQIPPAYRV